MFPNRPQSAEGSRRIEMESSPALDSDRQLYPEEEKDVTPVQILDPNSMLFPEEYKMEEVKCRYV